LGRDEVDSAIIEHRFARSLRNPEADTMTHGRERYAIATIRTRGGRRFF
jgi:hypothetical protein